MPKINRVCKYCGEVFQVYPSKQAEIFCSRAHYWAYRALPVESKTCSKCGETKPISEFHKSTTGRPGKDGYNSQCKECRSIYRRQYYQDNRDSQIKYSKSHYKEAYTRNPELNREKYTRNRERILERKHLKDARTRPALIQKSREAYWSNPDKFRKKAGEWAKQNRDKIKVRMRRYRDENRETVRLRQNRFYANNPDKAHEYRNRRRAMRRNNGGSYTTQEWKDLCEFYGNICLCCGIHAKDTPEGKLSPDHVIPLSRGGSNDISNIQPLCYKCNLEKHTLSTDYRPRRFQPRYKQLGFYF